jgi:glycosyltransferase involved in cell wall biosynthesis
MNAIILTKNNSKTIQKTLDSICNCCSRIIVGDLGSCDGTLDICRNYQAEIHYLVEFDRDQARNRLQKDLSGYNLMIEPWEIILKQDEIALTSDCYYVKLLKDKTITKEIRLWKGFQEFVNPTYECIKSTTNSEIDLILYSFANRDLLSDLESIKKWKETKPSAFQPYYYEACIYLTLGDHEKFLNAIQHYLFLNRTPSISTIMSHYYMAYAYICKKEVKKALQNINICLSYCPLMAEFWCILGDVYYHLLKKFDEAIEFYENAMILGAKRLKTDKYPIDLTKYKEYPEKMIASCNKIKETQGIYVR